MRNAFPDWHNQIDEIFAVDDRVVTRGAPAARGRYPAAFSEGSGGSLTRAVA